MTRWFSVSAVALTLSCATSLSPVVKVKREEVYRGPKHCTVLQYPSASDVPTGAQNLGWMLFPQGESDEATYQIMFTAVCDKGGDAVSSLAWVKEPGDERPQLKANAWVLP